MKEKYELKTTVAEFESAEFGNYHKDLKKIQHDARLAHELLARVKFLEKVAIQATIDMWIDGTEIRMKVDDGPEFLYEDTDTFPPLAQYLREREPQAGEGTVGGDK